MGEKIIFDSFPFYDVKSTTEKLLAHNGSYYKVHNGSFLAHNGSY